MKRTLLIGILALAGLLAAKPAPPIFSELVGRAHLAGCALSEHPSGSRGACVLYRAELRAALRQERRQAFREAAALARQEKDAARLAEAFERRARE